jgi:hypothetical protein
MKVISSPHGWGRFTISLSSKTLYKRTNEATVLSSKAVYGIQNKPGDLLLNNLLVCFSKQIQQHAAEIVSVAVWVSQLVCNGVQEMIAS